jgi:quercetin dioxygenase-like cupin family protein
VEAQTGEAQVMTFSASHVALFVLSGHAFLWTERTRAEVQPGDVIFLPRRQLHSLECTSDGGMRLVGVFFPAGSPAVNY